MVENSEDMGLIEITVVDPAIAEQNKLITQLMQQVAEMRVNMQRARDLTNLVITANLPSPNGKRPPLHFPPPNPNHKPTLNNPTFISGQSTLTIDAYHASSSHHTPPPLENPNANNVQAFAHPLSPDSTNPQIAPLKN